jgi:hypothetical protein
MASSSLANQYTFVSNLLELEYAGSLQFNKGPRTAYVARSKNGESRYVDLNDEGIALFAEMTMQRKQKELIFLRSNGKPWKQSRRFSLGDERHDD